MLLVLYSIYLNYDSEFIQDFSLKLENSRIQSIINMIMY